MKVKVDSIKIVGLHRVFFSRVDALVRRVQRGQPLAAITINATNELIEGEHELHAARRLGFDEVEIIMKEQP